MKWFDAYINVIKYYRRRTPIQPSLVKANITDREVQDMENSIPGGKYKKEEKSKDEYLLCFLWTEQTMAVSQLSRIN